MITTQKYHDLAAHIKSEVESRIQTEFGHIPIVADTQWATPDWTVICYAGDDIASFYNIVERKVFIDGTAVVVGGISNVITSSGYRGKGHASRMLRETEQFLFEQLKCQLGLLLCSDELVPSFYERLRWHRVNCPVFFHQASGEHLWNANTMLLSNHETLHPERINLNGLPW